eukprot:scaffold535236_cov59-Attheya_sp.AAC.1
MSHNGFLLVLMSIIVVAILNTCVASTSQSTGTGTGGSGSQKKFLGANWKGSLETTQEVDGFVDDLNRMWGSLSREDQEAVELCVNPPFVFLDRVRSRIARNIVVGSQNVFDAR